MNFSIEIDATSEKDIGYFLLCYKISRVKPRGAPSNIINAEVYLVVPSLHGQMT